MAQVRTRKTSRNSRREEIFVYKPFEDYPVESSRTPVIHPIRLEKEHPQLHSFRMSSTLSNATGHTHENSLRSELEGPEPNFLEASFPGLVVDDVSGKCLIGLESYHVSKRKKCAQHRGPSLPLPKDRPSVHYQR